MANPFKRLIQNMKASGRRAGKTYVIELSWEDLEKMFLQQDKRCYWTKMPLDPMDIFKTGNLRAISADRLDNDKGYTWRNTVISCRFVNLGRVATTEKDFNIFLEELTTHIRES